MSSRQGFVQAVGGLVRPDQLSATLMHERVLCDLTPLTLAKRGGDDVEITLENVWQINCPRSVKRIGVVCMVDRDVASSEKSAARFPGPPPSNQRCGRPRWRAHFEKRRADHAT